MLLEVYNNPNHPNHGITFRIIDHELPLPHDAGSVILVFHGREYSATVGAYNQTNTLRSATDIRPLIENFHWAPGALLPCDFEIDGQTYIFRV